MQMQQSATMARGTAKVTENLQQHQIQLPLNLQRK